MKLLFMLDLGLAIAAGVIAPSPWKPVAFAVVFLVTRRISRSDEKYFYASRKSMTAESDYGTGGDDGFDKVIFVLGLIIVVIFIVIGVWLRNF